MTVSSLQATQWTTEGAQGGAQATYASVKTALERAGIVASASLEIFLQGSYANHTNVRADSDVDIVLMSKRTYFSNVSQLGPAARARHEARGAASYSPDDLRRDALAALRAYYGGARVHDKNKCIRIDAGAHTLDADVVPTMQYRLYTKPDPNLDRDFIEGVRLQPRHGGEIINYPKEHIANGQAKNSAAAGNYKKTVRQVKRLRSFAVQAGYLPEGIAPGYVLECMTFNAPSSLFHVYDDRARLVGVLNWLRSATLGTFWSCDQVHLLFRTDPGRFSEATGRQIAQGLWAAV